MDLSLRLAEGELAVVRLGPRAGTPEWLDWSARPLVSVTVTDDEMSVVCPAGDVPAGVRSVGPWRAFRIEGTIDFALTGVLASVLNPLAAAEIGIFALSTFDTDWILVRAESVDAAAAALSAQFRVYGVEPIGG